MGWTGVVLFLLLPFLNLSGALEMFLRLNGIEGEAEDPAFKSEMKVLAWSWGASNSGTTHTGSTAGTSKANIQDLSVTKYIDKASPDLLLHVLKGDHIADGTLTVRTAGATPRDLLVIMIENIIVSSYSTGASGGEDKPTENISLNFQKLKYIYSMNDKDKYEVSWDVYTGKGG